MDAAVLAQLDDERYDKLVISNTHPPARDPEIWAALTQPANLDRTRAVVYNAHQRTGNVLRTRKEERDAFQVECFARGYEGKRDWYASRSEYDQWRRRAANFHQTMQRALGELGKLKKDVNRSANHQIAQEQRESLRQLAQAVQRHQAAHAKAGGIADQTDYELWRHLERITVPCGPDQEQVSLRTMLEVYWSNVVPVDDSEERRVQAERTMRSLPGGQHSGMPRARHVHNDKKLA